jgi:hypothetical protein
MTIEEVKELPIGAMVEVREISPRWPNCWRLVILRKYVVFTPETVEVIAWANTNKSSGRFFMADNAAPLDALADNLFWDLRTRRVA